MKMSQIISREESWGSQILTSCQSPSVQEQVPSVVLVFNGPTEDIAPCCSERSSPESSDFDGLPPEPSASLAWEWKAEALVRWGEGFVCGLLFPGSLPVGQRLRASQCAAHRTIQPSSPGWSVLQSPPICCCLPDVLIPPDKLGNIFVLNWHVPRDNTGRNECIKSQ